VVLCVNILRPSSEHHVLESVIATINSAALFCTAQGWRHGGAFPGSHVAGLTAPAPETKYGRRLKRFLLLCAWTSIKQMEVSIARRDRSEWSVLLDHYFFS
jgi:hypothetical protein